MHREEERLRAEIAERVAEIYRLRKETEPTFIPGKSRVHYAGRVYDEREMQAMVDSVLDFWLTLGSRGQAFVKGLKEFTGHRHGLLVNSGSSANLIAVAALCSPQLENHLKPGDEVITPALTFPTTLAPIVQNGLVPVFVDVEADTYNLDASLLEQAISPKTRAIVLAHTLGNPAQMDRVMEVANRHNLFVVEDCCDALGSRYQGQLCGSFGHLMTVSFYAAHHITMGEGGAVLTNDTNLYRQALSLRDWGRACWCETGEAHPDGACRRRFSHNFPGLPPGYDHKYVYTNIGYNLKPLDIQCAMGVEQLGKLPGFIQRRKENFAFLYEAVKPYEEHFVLPRALPGADPAWFAFPLTVRPYAPFSRRDLVMHLEKEGIETRTLFAGNILRHPGYRDIAHRVSGTLENTNQVLEHSFFLGVYPGMTPEHLAHMADAINRFMAAL